MKNHKQNVVEKLVPDHFEKFKVENISRSTVWNFIQFAFVACPSRRLSNYIDTKVLTDFTSYKALLNNKKGSGTSFSACLIFCIIFGRKIFFTLYSINWSNFIVWLPLCLEIWGNICTVIICFAIILSYQAVWLHDQKSQDKHLNILGTKRAFKVK